MIMHDSIVNIEDQGYKVYSVTTDGFISNIPEKFINNILNYGATVLSHKLLQTYREKLDGNKEYYSIKHSNKGFYNYTTRGNISFNIDGVRAKNGYKGQYVEDDLIIKIYENDYILKDIFTKPNNIKNIFYKGEEYIFETVEKNIMFDYDFKRDIDTKTVQDINFIYYDQVNNTKYDLKGLYFETIPYQDKTDYKNKKERIIQENKRTNSIMSLDKESFTRKNNKINLLIENNTKDGSTHRKINDMREFAVRVFLVKLQFNDVNEIITNYFKKIKREQIINMINDCSDIDFKKEKLKKLNIEKYKKTRQRAKNGELDNLLNIKDEYIDNLINNLINKIKETENNE